MGYPKELAKRMPPIGPVKPETFVELPFKGGGLEHEFRFGRGGMVGTKFRDSDTYAECFGDRHDAFPDNYGMAILNQERLCKTLMKYDTPSEEFTSQQQLALSIAASYVQQHYRPYLGGSRVMSLEEVIAHPDVRFDSSPGFPWNLKYPTAEDALLDNEEWFEDAFYSISQASSYLPPSMFNMFPKDELLPKEKIEVGKLRTIWGTPLEAKLLGNCLFLDVMQKMNKSHGKHNSEIGIVKYYLGWHVLWNKLGAGWWDGLPLDMIGFDTKTQARLSFISLDIFKSFIDDKGFLADRFDDNVIWFKYNVMKGSVKLPGGEVVSKENGLPSGTNVTANLNTMNLNVAYVYVYIRWCQDNSRTPSYEEFHTNMKLALYGDDNTFTCSPKFKKIMTFETITKYVKELGWGVTCDIPRQEDGFCKLEDMEFLSCRFKRYGALMLPEPVDASKAFSSLRHKSKGDPFQDYAAACSHYLNNWTNQEAREQLKTYMDYLEREYIMKGSEEAIKIALSQRPSDLKCVEIYTGLKVY